MSLVAVTAGCGSRVTAPDTVSSDDAGLVPPPDAVARVGSEWVRIDEVAPELERRGARVMPDEVLQAVITERLLAQAAQRAGLADDPEIAGRVRRLLSEAYLDRELGAVMPDDQAQRAWYAAHADRFTVPERRRGGLVWLRFDTATREAAPDRVRARAATCRAEMLDATTESAFADVVRRYSDDAATRYQGGDTGWIESRSDAPLPQPAWVEALFRLPAPGSVSPPVEQSEGLYLIRLTALRPATTQSFETVRDQVAFLCRRDAEAQARERLLQRLLATTETRIFSNTWNQLTADYRPRMPSGPAPMGAGKAKEIP